MPDAPQPLIQLIPPGADLPDAVARALLARHAAQLPDLSRITVGVASPALASALLRALLRGAGGALLAPRIVVDLGGLAPAADAAGPLACRLRLAEAVARFRFLFPGQTPLRVAEALFTLFEELEQQQVALPDDEAVLEALLLRGYGADRPLAALSREAQIVHRLHRAYLEELGPRAPSMARAEALRAMLRDWPADAPLWLVGFDQFTPAEAAALRPALTKPAVSLFAQGRREGRDGAACHALFAQLGIEPTVTDTVGSPRSRLLDAAFAEGDEPRARAMALGSADAGDLAFVEAGDAEHEAQIADLAVREALLAGARRVAVVCEDRRLARRLRARLERAGITLADRGGWALSTSRAAAALDAWMGCLDGDFPFRALFAVLKSGFLDGGEAWAETLEPRAYDHAIAGGSARWRSAMASPAEQQRWDRLAEAARALTTLRGPHPATEHADGLLASLDASGLAAGLAGDLAGARVLERLRELREALAATTLTPGWPAFRALVDAALEDASFSAGDPASPVQLLTLSQTQGLVADALVLTGATPALLAADAAAPFFNRSVRRELGLPTTATRQALGLARLRRLLEAAPRVRISYAPGESGETAQLAPALAALAAFAEAAGTPIRHDRALAARAPLAEIAVDSDLPAATEAPAPAALPALVERSLSARGHQTLIDCPYAFHARYALGLERLEDPDTPVDRRDYGDRVHRILRAFEEPVAGLPPPWTGPRDAAALPSVTAHLNALADAVFAADLAARPLARLWRAEFGAAVLWLAEQLCDWPRAAVRVECELDSLRDGWRLHGRIDRLEDEGHRVRLIDHKTGNAPSVAALKAGEAVQLSHYALLTDPVTRIEYWNLKEQKATGLDGEPLQDLAHDLSARLQRLSTSLRVTAPLPANGADTVCERCDYLGVCRRGDWSAMP